MRIRHGVYATLAVLAVVLVWVIAAKPEYEIRGVGFDDAPAGVVVREFSDFQCPACGATYPVVKEIKGAYSREQMRFEYKHFPLRQIHPFAFKAAQASECARDQERFEAYHDKLFENQRALRVQDLKRYAAELGLETKAFDACLDSNAMAPRVEGNLQEGIRLGVHATPTFFINRKKHEGVLDAEKFKELVDAELAEA